MGFSTLSDCVAYLKGKGEVREIDYPVDPYLEMGIIQRRAFKLKAPALLFTHPRNTVFPMLANLYGTRNRLNHIFGKNIEKIKHLFTADKKAFLKNPLKIFSYGSLLFSLVPKKRNFTRDSIAKVACLKNTCSLAQLPQLVSWPKDGGPFITLPIVQSADPHSGKMNLGMYRTQLSGNNYLPDEVGMHYQIHRGIGTHHAKALAAGKNLPVHIYVGGPPALALGAVMPFPEGLNELAIVSLLMGKRIQLASIDGFQLPVICNADFLLKGYITSTVKPEGPFGDHLGYYSLTHNFPVVKIEKVFHKDNAIWPFTTVGRPPQEDTVFGDLIHELTKPLVTTVFPGICQIHAVDAAGVHPLLLAMGSERYAPYESIRKPRELITQAFHLLGKSQTALAKYIFIGAQEDSDSLDVRDIEPFLKHILERTDFKRDIHFICEVNCDTLDYSGSGLNEGSKLIWAAAGSKKRNLGVEIGNLSLPQGFTLPHIVMPGILIITGQPHLLDRGNMDQQITGELLPALSTWKEKENFPLIVVADDAKFTAKNMDNFLWVTFSRSDPSMDIYGVNSCFKGKHWNCDGPVIIDARIKKFHAPKLEDDPETVKRLEKLAIKNGPLYGIF